MSYPSYPEYKDAGFVGLDQVPSHWEVVRFKRILEEVNQGSKTGEESLLSVSEYYGVRPRVEVMEEGEHLSRAESLEGYKLCKPTDLVMNIMLAWKRGLGISDHYGIVSPSYAVFRFVAEVHSRYYHYLLRSDEYIGYFKTFSSGVVDSRLRLYPEVFGRLTGLYPPLKEQAQIARFLDDQTARIDALIAEQQRLIELLKEKRQAVISHAVTKGLDPDVAMKDSGVEWLGKVPEHWELVPIGLIAEKIQTGPFGSQLHAHEYVESGVPVINPANIKDGQIVPDSHLSVSDDVALRLSHHKLSAGDLIVGRRGEMGRCAVVHEYQEGWICGTGSMKISLGDKVNSHFLSELIRTSAFRERLKLESVGSTMDNLNPEIVSSM